VVCISCTIFVFRVEFVGAKARLDWAGMNPGSCFLARSDSLHRIRREMSTMSGKKVA